MIQIPIINGQNLKSINEIREKPQTIVCIFCISGWLKLLIFRALCIFPCLLKGVPDMLFNQLIYFAFLILLVL